MPKRWIPWLVVLLSLVAVGGSVGALLIALNLAAVGVMLLLVCAIAAYLWLVGGTMAASQPRYIFWMVVHLGLGAAGTLLAGSFFWIDATATGLSLIGVAILVRSALVFRLYTTRPSWRPAAVGLLGYLDVAVLCAVCWQVGYRGGAIALGGIACMALCFFVGLWLVRLMLSPGRPILGVARTLIDEAIRMRIALVFIVLLLLIVPVMPYLNDPEELLRYRIGTFLAWSLGATSVLLSLMTVFVACGSICGELKEHQIFLTMSKPVSRAQYLVGKWLGMALLNLVLLLVAGGGIYTFARIMQQFPASVFDRLAVTDQVLVARTAIVPQLPGGQTLDDLVVKQLKRTGVDLATVTPATRKEALNQVVNRWHTIARFDQQTYVFTGLDGLKGHVESVQLKVKPAASNAPDNQQIQFMMRINGRPFRINPQKSVNELKLSISQIINIPTSLIDDQGRLIVIIENKHPEGRQMTYDTDISFTPDKGFQLLYRYGAFGPNLVRGLTMVWIQLGFLAMIGLAAGSFLGFPVACLLALMVYITGVASGFLSESLSAYAVSLGNQASAWQTITGYPAAMLDKLSQGEIWAAVKVLIQVIGELFVALIPAFNQYNPTPLIADGQVVAPKLLMDAALKVGLAWTGMAMVIGYVIFRKRELARIMV